MEWEQIQSRLHPRPATGLECAPEGRICDNVATRNNRSAVRQTAFSLFEPPRPRGGAPHLERPRANLELPPTPRVQIALPRLGRRAVGPHRTRRVSPAPGLPVPARASAGEATSVAMARVGEPGWSAGSRRCRALPEDDARWSRNRDAARSIRRRGSATRGRPVRSGARLPSLSESWDSRTVARSGR